MITPTNNIRSIHPEEADEMLQVLCAAFRLDFAAARPLFYQDPFFDLSHKLALWLPDEGLTSCLTVIPSSIRIGGTAVRAAGIAGVATRPHLQMHGYAAALIKATLADLSGSFGYPLSMLFPFSHRYYRRFGWEVASRSVRWSALLKTLPLYRERQSVRPISEASPRDQKAIHSLYENLTLSKTGPSVRDDRRWHVIERLVQGRETVVYEHHGTVSGYLMYDYAKVTESGSSAIRIHEMHATDAAARRGFIGFLAQQASRYSTVEWAATYSALQQFGLLSPVAIQEDNGGAMIGLLPSFKIEPGVMLRIVNLRDALNVLHTMHYQSILAASRSSLTICAIDPLLAANQTPVRMDADGVGAGSIEDTHRITVDIRFLAQLYTGYTIPSDLHSRDLLQASNPDALALADKLFPLREPYLAPPDQF